MGCAGPPVYMQTGGVPWGGPASCAPTAHALDPALPRVCAFNAARAADSAAVRPHNPYHPQAAPARPGRPETRVREYLLPCSAGPQSPPLGPAPCTAGSGKPESVPGGAQGAPPPSSSAPPLLVFLTGPGTQVQPLPHWRKRGRRGAPRDRCASVRVLTVPRGPFLGTQ